MMGKIDLKAIQGRWDEESDAKALEHAPEDIAALLAEVKRLRIRIAKVTVVMANWNARSSRAEDKENRRLITAALDNSAGCTRCDGCGQIANTPSGEPWRMWASLPSDSNMAVILGLVKPIPCPACST